jgi:hypothetical protein
MGQKKKVSINGLFRCMQEERKCVLERCLHIIGMGSTVDQRKGRVGVFTTVVRAHTWRQQGPGLQAKEQQHIRWHTVWQLYTIADGMVTLRFWQEYLVIIEGLRDRLWQYRVHFTCECALDRQRQYVHSSAVSAVTMVECTVHHMTPTGG